MSLSVVISNENEEGIGKRYKQMDGANPFKLSLNNKSPTISLRRSCLIANDEPMQLNVLQTLFSSLDFEVVTA